MAALTSFSCSHVDRRSLSEGPRGLGSYLFALLGACMSRTCQTQLTSKVKRNAAAQPQICLLRTVGSTGIELTDINIHVWIQVQSRREVHEHDPCYR